MTKKQEDDIASQGTTTGDDSDSQTGKLHSPEVLSQGELTVPDTSQDDQITDSDTPSESILSPPVRNNGDTASISGINTTPSSSMHMSKMEVDNTKNSITMTNATSNDINPKTISTNEIPSVSDDGIKDNESKTFDQMETFNHAEHISDVSCNHTPQYSASFTNDSTTEGSVMGRINIATHTTKEPNDSLDVLGMNNNTVIDTNDKDPGVVVLGVNNSSVVICASHNTETVKNITSPQHTKNNEDNSEDELSLVHSTQSKDNHMSNVQVTHKESPPSNTPVSAVLGGNSGHVSQESEDISEDIGEDELSSDHLTQFSDDNMLNVHATHKGSSLGDTPGVAVLGGNNSYISTEASLHPPTYRVICQLDK